MSDREPAEAELVALLGRWVRARPLGLPAAGPAAVPPELAETLTAREPERGAALAEAPHFLQAPQPLGLGLTVDLAGPLSEAPHGPWERSAGPVHLALRYSTTMDAGFDGREEEVFERVAVEGGRWVVVALWGGERLGARLRELELLRGFLRSRGG